MWIFKNLTIKQEISFGQERKQSHFGTIQVLIQNFCVLTRVVS